LQHCRQTLGDFFILGWAIGCKAALAIITGNENPLESHDDLITAIGGKGGGRPNLWRMAVCQMG